jgi:peptide deformylase
MPAREILLLGNPGLHERSLPAEPSARQTVEAIADLADTLHAFRRERGFGRAIAAPQIGVLRRIVLLDLGAPRPLINPRIVRASSETMELWDDCFSFPELLVRVRRSASVDVEHLDEHGARHVIAASGDLAELLQHELDHLDGILATERAIDARSFALRSEVRGRL